MTENRRRALPSGEPGRSSRIVSGFVIGYLSFAVFCAAGCGTQFPKTVVILGAVTWQDKPLTNGRVVFHPHQIEEGLPKRPATGDLDEQGRFQLTTFRAGDGVMPGSYRVCVISYENAPSADDDVTVFVPRWRIPEHYGNPQTSDLKAEVPSSGPVELPPFELKEKK